MKDCLIARMKIFSGSMLKLIAAVSMFIDHTAHILYRKVEFLQYSLFTVGAKEITVYYIMRKIGRLAFPIFCFLIMEGFIHTKNPKKYGARLLFFAILSEIPFNLMMGNSILYNKCQNVFFTLLFGVLLIYCFENIKNEFWKFLCMGLIATGAVIMDADYGLRGALLPLLLYVLRANPAVQAILAYPLLAHGIAAFAAFVPINMYNGQRGFIQTTPVKLMFYWFYPVHILLLVMIKYIL